MNDQPKLHIVLHQPEIAPNTGAVGRTCVALGAKLWLVRPLGFRLNEKTLRRAGLDYWQHLDWEVVDNWQALVDRLKSKQMWFFSRFADRSYLAAGYGVGDVLVFGSETSGLPPSLVSEAKDRLLRIPTAPEVRSLNLSCAVAVAAYEATRQLDSNSGD